MNSAFTDSQARIARIGGVVGALIALALIGLAFWMEADVARLYVWPLLLLATCAAFFVAGRRRQRSLEALALVLLGITLLVLNLPAFVAGLRGDVSTLDFVLEGLFGNAMGLFFVGLGGFVFFEMDARASGRDV